ncbi:MAG TPA: S41 family peptidase [Gemmatimonadales bacterium]|nr:S41 family peptidase [Gemmatimonadales bacterium]
MRTLARVLFLSVVAVALAAAAPFVPDFLPADDADRTAWRRDLDRLEAHLARAYANFQWTVEADSLDLPALHRVADSSLAAASSRRAARRAFRDLIDAFDDGHLHASPPDHPFVRIAERALRGSGEPIEAGASASSACRRLGFSAGSHGFGIPFDEMPGYAPVAADPFPAGIAPAAGERVAVIRIASFGEQNFGAACEEAWHARAAVSGDPCDDACADALYDDVSRRLVATFARTLERIELSGVRTLIVDVTGNGGGSGLADALARELSPLALRASPVGLIRHPHSLKALVDQESLLVRELARADLPEQHRALLDSARAQLSATIRNVETPCDVSPLWRGEDVACPQLVSDGMYSTGVLPYVGAGKLDGLDVAPLLFYPLSYGYREGAYTGRLFVVMDRSSASATELFAALLHDNGAATLIGERSWGAGCGYTNGGVQLELPSVKMTLHAPDCARLRASGENERAGLMPDLPLDWTEENAAERARMALAAAASSARTSRP